MTFIVEPTNARAWSDEALEALFAEGFPAFSTADQEVKKYIGRVRDCFPELDVMLVDSDGAPAATGWGVPLAWSGQVDDLPRTFADLLRRTVEGRDANIEANTFVICGGVVHPRLKRTGTATELITALKAIGRRQGLVRALAPLRPTRKHVYPVTPIADYAGWTRDDGLPFDPWLRLHVRMGARVIALAPEAQTMTGTVAQWEEWTGMELPGSGSYVIPQGMGVLDIDRFADLGTYVEPNIWVEHHV
jgi:GNAT superfamily N-acetyltransferase